MDFYIENVCVLGEHILLLGNMSKKALQSLFSFIHSQITLPTRLFMLFVLEILIWKTISSSGQKKPPKHTRENSHAVNKQYVTVITVTLTLIYHTEKRTRQLVINHEWFSPQIGAATQGNNLKGSRGNV